MLPADSAAPAVWHRLAVVSQFVAMLRRLMRLAEVDRAVVFGFLTRIWGLGSGPVTMLLIASRFTPELQGYYYTFGSLLALQIFVELGLGQVILQFASHEWSRLSLDEDGWIVGDPQALSRLVSLGRFVFRWYAVAGGLVAVGLGLAGFVFFSHSPQIGIDWAAPWFVLCIFTGINLCLLPLWSLLEGCNQVAQVYACRLGQGLLRSLSIWSALLLGAGLWTGPASSIVDCLWAALFLYWRYGRFFRSFFAPGLGPNISWRAEIWPLQWRIAGSWLSGYFVFSLFTPVLFHYHGPVVAGQMGMTWALVSFVISVSSTWPLTKAPQFGMLIAEKKYDTLDKLFFKVALITWCVVISGALAIWIAIYFLYYFDYNLASRILPPLPAGLFLLATVVVTMGVPMSIYLRAHKKEPLLILSIVAALLTGLSTLILGKHFAATGMACGYLFLNIIFTPLVILIWYRCRKKWHSA